MTKEDNIDAINFYVKQKQIDEMREYTKDYGRDQFVRALVNQRTEIVYLKQALNEIRECIYKNSIPMNLLSNPPIEKLDFEGDAKDILQIIDKYMKEDD